jgi:hypothetical protein
MRSVIPISLAVPELLKRFSVGLQQDQVLDEHHAARKYLLVPWEGKYLRAAWWRKPTGKRLISIFRIDAASKYLLTAWKQVLVRTVLRASTWVPHQS